MTPDVRRNRTITDHGTLIPGRFSPFWVRIRFLVCLVTATWSWSAARADETWLNGQIGELNALYRQLHGQPELSFQEEKTAQRIGDELKAAGYAVTRKIGKHGIVGILENGDGPTVLVRTDLDGLPIVEETGLPYASKVRVKDADGNTVGTMHACGHDMHMTCFVGVARWLATHKDAWSGRVIMLGQPAEERGLGAKAMLDDGLYTRFPLPDYALALHVAHDLEAGKIAYTRGPAMASATSVDVVVKGRGGHGAMPHQAVDPIVLAAALVMDLQTIVSREIFPIQPAVITVGSIHGGTKHNIIPDDVKLQLTLRAYTEDVRQQLIAGIERKAKGLAQAHRAPAPTVKVIEGTPPTINNPELTDRVIAAIAKTLGPDRVAPMEPTMGAEDFGQLGVGKIPIFMFRLGVVPPEKAALAKKEGKTLPTLHSPLFFPDPDPSIRTGVTAMTSAVISLMPPKK